MVTANGVPEIWLEGVPVRPLGVAGAGVCPGSKIWRRLKLPALTSKPALDPSLLGWSASHAYRTEPSDVTALRNTVTSPFQLPPLIVTVEGEVAASVKFVRCLRFT